MVCEQQAARYSDVFALREFRSLFVAQLLSVVGDQFARVALSVLVFDRTKSPGLTALAYALTYLPDLVAGPLLAGIADRYPRRTVMVATDLARAILVALMALPGVPLTLLCALLVGVHVLGAPFSAARAATLAQVLWGDRYLLGTGAADMVDQLAQVLGFAVGGLVIIGMGPSRGLQIDAATFLLSAVIVRFGVHDRPVPAFPTVRDPVQPWWPSLVTGAVTVWTTPKLRALVLLACVAGFYVTIEALAVPYSVAVTGAENGVGLLLAAGPAGTILGMWAISRLLPGRRLKLLGPLAMLACFPLVLAAFRPSVPLMVALLVMSGIGSAYHMVARSAFVQSVPDHGRGQAFGLAVTALRTAQGTGLLLAGVFAEVFGAPAVLSGAGITGTLVAAGAGLTWYQARRRPR